MVPIIIRIGSALTSVHTLGRIHRDIKPANVLLRNDGAPKLTDFDLVGGKHTTGGTKTGAMGSFVYSAPELMHRPQDATLRSDIYSLAMTALFILSGEELPMTVMRSAEVFIAQLDCAEELKDVLSKALDWESEKRFSDVEEFCAALISSCGPPVAAKALQQLGLWSEISLNDQERALISRVADTFRSNDTWAEVALLVIREAEAARSNKAQIFLDAAKIFHADAGDIKRAIDVLLQAATARPCSPPLKRLIHEVVRTHRSSEEIYLLIRAAVEVGAEVGAPEYLALRRQVVKDQLDFYIDCTKCGTVFAMEPGQVAPGENVFLRCSVCSHIFFCERIQVSDVRRVQREWKLRRRVDGQTIALNTLVQLLELLENDQVAGNDTLSNSGVNWTKVSEIAEFSSFLNISLRNDGPLKRVFRAISESDVLEKEPCVPSLAPRLESVLRDRQDDDRERADQRWGVVIADRYRLEDLLVLDERGAFYRARDTEVGRPCGVRVLPRIFDDDERLRGQLMRCVSLMQAGLRHPNAVNLFDIGHFDDSDESRVYVVSEWVDGVSLRSLLDDRETFTAERIIAIARQVCGALSAAHQAGVVHGGLTPSSIVLVARPGEPNFVKVVDFCMPPSLESPLKEVGEVGAKLIMGSPGYMSPEEANGELASSLSDVYALGVIIFEMLCGYLPFKGTSANMILKKRMRDAPHIIKTEKSGTPEGLADLVNWCLDRRPEQRPTSMQSIELILTKSV